MNMTRRSLALCTVFVAALLSGVRSSNAPVSETILYSFGHKPDGQVPVARLMRDADGSLYGTTANGGGLTHCGQCGTVYKLTPSGDGYTESLLHQFHGSPDGDGPSARLYEDKSGNLFGTTVQGGYNDNGTRRQGSSSLLLAGSPQIVRSERSVKSDPAGCLAGKNARAA